MKPGPRFTRPLLRRALADERGGIIAFVAVAMVMLLASTGLAVDLGRGYVERLRLGRAVDAGALAAARALRMGQSVAQSEAVAVAGVNGVMNGQQAVSTSIQFAINSRGENTVTMSANRVIPTTFMRVLGRTDMNLAVSATAAVPPVDLVLVLDQSGSLGLSGSFGTLQSAARDFVSYFDDSIDQVGLVSFQLGGTDRFQINHGFTTPVTQAIQAMQSAGDTNMGEGLRLALNQMQRPNVRPRSGKVVVFFTDGQATAVRAPVGPPGNPVDRVIAVYSNPQGVVRGYFDSPDQIPPDVVSFPDGCQDWAQCWIWDEATVRTQGQLTALQLADQLRSAEVTIYSIGLGDPTAAAYLQPDLDFLRDIANEGGRVNAGQPQGKVFFAPTPAELAAMFDLVARDLMVRLSR